MMKLLVLLGLCLLAPMVQAGFVEGEEAFNNQRYAQAFTEFKPLADAGDFRAQYYVGYLYLYGYGGVEQNNQLALSYLRQSEADNYDLAQSLLGFLYYEGKVVPQNKDKALELYKKAAEQGNTSAFLNLGVAYYAGDGVDKDIDLAISYFEKIPLNEKPVVGRYLGDIYLYDPDALDYEKAVTYYTTAAKEGDLGAYHALAYMNQKALGIPENMEDAKKYYLYAASQNHAPSQYALGAMYANGEMGNRDMIKGYAWISLAVDGGLKVAEKAQKKIAEGMTLSDFDQARRETLDIQERVLGKIEKPLQPDKPKESVAGEVEVESDVIRRPRRRRR